MLLSVSTGAPAALDHLRVAVAKIEGHEADLENDSGRLPLGIEPIDTTLGGGLQSGAVHEITPAAPLHNGPAAGFVLALIARLRGHALWIKSTAAGLEAGHLYAPGLTAFGLQLEKLIILHVARPVDVLWAMEEGLKSSALTAIVAELDQKAEVGLTATRRLALAAARTQQTFGFLLRQNSSDEPNASATRWRIAAGSGHPDAFGGLGATAFDISLVKNRHGRNGRWTVCWDHHECQFTPLSVGVVAPSRNRSARADIAGVC